jgi:hypothetical protein
VDGAGSAALGIEFEDGPAEVKIARGHIVEMEAPRANGKFRVVVNRDGLPQAAFPPDGWLEMDKTQGHTSATGWGGKGDDAG